MLLERGERPVVFDVALNERLLNAVGVDTTKVTLIRGDMMDLPAIISAIRDNECDRIIHLAAFLGEEVQRRPYSGVRLNFMGTVNVFEAARLEKVSRVIFPSSGTVYLGSIGEGLQKIDEGISMNPPSVYAATKASCEFMGASLCQALWVRVCLPTLCGRALRAIADGSQGNAGNSDSRDDSSGCERSSSKD